MSKISFKIIGIPVPKGRPRFFRRGRFVGTYTPPKTKNWETIVRGQAVASRPPMLWEGPLRMKLIFMMPRPKSLPKKVIHHIKKPDVDNLAKAIKDALQGIIYKTDSQVVMLTAMKIYATAEPRVEVDIEEVDHEE